MALFRKNNYTVRTNVRPSLPRTVPCLFKDNSVIFSFPTVCVNIVIFHGVGGDLVGLVNKFQGLLVK